MFRVLYKTDRTVKSATLLLVVLAMATMPSPLYAATFDDVEVTCWAGVEPGPEVKETLLVIDWQEPEDSVVFGYRWQDTASGADMLDAITLTDDRFYYEWHPFYAGVIYGIGWDAGGVDYYRFGWEYYDGGYWSHYSSSDGEAWSYSGSGAEGELTDGDWVGWSWEANFIRTEPDNIPFITIGDGTPGDTNGDGEVDATDYANLLAQFGLAAPDTDSADFNGDNVIDLQDFAILRLAMSNSASSPSSPESVASTPEPTTLMLLAFGASGVLARRRRL